MSHPLDTRTDGPGPEPTSDDAAPDDAGRAHADAAVADHAGPTTRRGRVTRWVDARPGWLRWTLAALVLLGLSGALVLRFAVGTENLSRADEYVYVDAVDKATRGEITRQGATVDHYARDLLACYGVDIHGPQGQVCGGPHDVSTFPYRGGITSADIHTPAYFFLTAGLAKVVQTVTPVDDLLWSARLTGALWLGLGLTGIVWLARTLGASRMGAAAAAALVLAAPSVRWTNAFITPDALNLLFGSVTAVAAVQYARGRWRAWPLFLIAALASVIKAQNSIGIALAALFLVLVAVSVPEGRTWRRLLRHVAVGGGAVLTALAVQAGYGVLRTAWAIAPAPEADTSAPLDWRSAANQVRAFLLPVTGGPDSTYRPAVDLASPSPLSSLISYTVAAALIGGALFAVLPTLQQRFAQATLLGVLTAAPLFYVFIYVATGRTFGLPDRYGMVLLPAMVAVLALLARRRWVQVLLLVLAGGALLEAMVRLSMS